MTNATLRGKPDAGNPHVRFDEGEVASAKPRRESLLYKSTRKGLALAMCAAALLAGAADVEWKWDDSGRSATEPVVVEQTQTQGVFAWLSVWQILSGISVDTGAPGCLIFIR